MTWWTTREVRVDLRTRAVAYYRHSAQDRQKNSVEIQMDQVRSWADKHQVEIIHEFADRGRSGLTAEGRPAFTEMMEWVRTRDDFTLVLVLDVSRWGRFQDTDLSAQYCSECTRSGKEVRYVNLGVENDGSPVYSLVVNFERWRSAQYSRELSDKVFKGCVKISEQGYRAGGSAPYATQRVMLNEHDVVERALSPGERKSIQNWRVKLAPGESQQVEVVQEIFFQFAERGLDERQIAGLLNHRGLSSPGGSAWSPGSVRRILGNRTYAGAVVYNRTSSKLKSTRRLNPRSEWVVRPEAFEAVVPAELFERVQSRLAERQLRLDPAVLLEQVRRLYDRYGVLTKRLVDADGDLPTFGTLCRHLGGVTGSLHRLYADVHARARDEVHRAIAAADGDVQPHDDFLVINGRFTVLIQPAIPTRGVDTPSWLFKPDLRPNVDITLGVPLSDCGEGKILGYVAMPRALMRPGWLRLSDSNPALVTLYGHQGLTFLTEYAR